MTMSPAEIPSRLEVLEREQQRLRLQVRGLLGLLLLGAGFGAWRTWGGERELRVARLVLMDGAGRPRAELGLATDSQEPRLVLSHADGRSWATLELASLPGAPPEARQATLALQDETGAIRVGLGASARDSGLVLYTSQGAPALSLYASEEAQGLTVSDGRSPRIHLRYNQHDDAERSELLFWDERQRPRVDVTAGRGGSSLRLEGPEGQRVFSAP